MPAANALQPDLRRAHPGACAVNDEAAAQPQAACQPRKLPWIAGPPLASARLQLAATASRSGIELRAYDNVEEISTEWREFEDRADLTVFQSFGWLANWQRHIGSARGTVPAIVIGSEADGEILFILQLAIYTTGPVRRLRWLGSQLCDYNAPLLAQDFSARTSAERFRLAWRDVIGLLRSDPFFYFDVIDLAKMPEWIGEQRNPFMDLRVCVHPSGAYLASLGQDWDTFYASKRSAATRKRERRQLRQLADHGEVRFVNVEGAEEIALTLSTLFEQKSDAFARMGVDNAFLQPGQREFFLAVATDPAMRDLVHVSRLDVGTQMAAISVGLKHRGCYYLILSSYTSAALSRFGPGRAQLSELLRHAIQQRLQWFDFTVGDEPYKRDWSDTELTLHDHLAAVTLRGWLFVTMLAVFRRIKRHIKQSPGLWRAFSRARALAGVLNSR